MADTTIVFEKAMNSNLPVSVRVVDLGDGTFALKADPALASALNEIKTLLQSIDANIAAVKTAVEGTLNVSIV